MIMPVSLGRPEPGPGAFEVARELIADMGAQLKAHNLPAVGECLARGEQLYRAGDQATRDAIENVFVFSFTHTFFCDEALKKEVMPMMPAFLYDMYRMQVLNSHL